VEQQRLKKNISLQLMVVMIVLWVGIIVSSLSVVYSTYDSRVKFNQLETLRREQNHLQVEWGQYLLEESTWAEYGRVEKLANEKLSMNMPEMEKIILIPSKNKRVLGELENEG
jgi:cell division protein FtsL